MIIQKKSPDELGAKFREETAPRSGPVTIGTGAIAFNQRSLLSTVLFNLARSWNRDDPLSGL
jgi:hypothetical protein